MQNFMVSQNNELTMQTASIRQNYLKVIGVHVYDTVVTEPETRFPVFFFPPNLSTTGREWVVSSWRVLDVFELYFN